MYPEKISIQAEMLANRLAKRQKHLKKWARRNGTDAYRLYDRDIPEIPLRIDLYACLVSLSLYERPYEKDEAEEDLWLEAMCEAAAGALGIEREAICTRRRKRQRGTAQYEHVSRAAREVIVREGGLRFRVNLSDYLDSGLFPDRRRLRARIREEAAGKKVLNLFCYTGGFSVYAASGGAASVDSVDLSSPYLEWTRVNFTLNALNPGNLVRADVLLFMEDAKRTRKTWDIIILDPPAFSNSKRMRGTIDLGRDHGELIKSCLSLLSPGGTLYFSANTKGFKLNAQVPGTGIEDITEKMRDEDFRGKRIPACFKFSSGA
ncbi:MAG: class I SAM-dependent methyltransferase [Treponema sp.]|jgi:23S rRNA G2069 N7-methylase RlmK/C1962 C5-methylase RlmI|nr:class I SAM-dependent methyltransferase [Treponema sp.]